jgi:hypothetical protein
MKKHPRTPTFYVFLDYLSWQCRIVSNHHNSTTHDYPSFSSSSLLYLLFNTAVGNTHLLQKTVLEYAYK